nr:protein grindelwald [Megalopta genalis]XP_033338581.1 protein grindelwald [Megalopta genalis]
MSVETLAAGLLLAGIAGFAGPMVEGMNTRRENCGDVCPVTEYCNKHNNLCTPCSNICDEDNYLEKECNAYCRVYLLARVERQYEDLRSEVSRLQNFSTAAIAVAFVSLVAVACLFASRFVEWKTVGGALRRPFSGAWRKKATANKSNNHENNNKTTEDAESAGYNRRNGPKLVMPTISATVAPARDPGTAIGIENRIENRIDNRIDNRIENRIENRGGSRANDQTGNRSGQGQGRANEAGSCAAADNGTPNTTTTTLSLSGRHPSEDTTLDYAYDNPAMTPSPVSVQVRRDRESSF